MIRVTADGHLEIDLKVVPRASRSKLGPRLGDRIKAQIAAPPVAGEANAVYAQFFPTYKPAKTGIGISQLWAGALIEIEVVAGR